MVFGKLSPPWSWNVVLGAQVAALWLWDSKWAFLLGVGVGGGLVTWLT